MSVFELVATGPQEGQRWRQILIDGKRVRLGRAPTDGWAVSWDMRISREHCDLRLEGEKLKVRCLDSALNPAHVQGQPSREFSIGEGESFRIGATTFHLGRRVESLSESDFNEPPVFDHSSSDSPPPKKGREQQNSSIRKLKDQVEQLKAQIAADAEAKRRKEEEEQRQKHNEVADLEAQLEELRRQIRSDVSKRSPDVDSRRAEESRLIEEIEARRMIEEEERRRADARRGEEEAQRLAEERRQAEEEARRQAEEEARRQAEEEEARRRAEEEEARRLEEEAEARRLAEEESHRQAEEEARRREEEAARRRAEEEARRHEEEEARRRAEEEARQRVEEEAKRRVEEEAKRRVEEEAKRRQEEEARRKAEEEARRRKEEEARRKAEEEARRKAEEEARRKAAEARRKAMEEEAQRLAEEAEALRKEEEEARRLAEEAAAKRRAREAEAKRRMEEAQQRLLAEEESQRLAAQAEEQRLAEVEEAWRAEEAQAQRQADEERRRAEEEARQQEESRRLAEQEAQRKREADEPQRRAEKEAASNAPQEVLATLDEVPKKSNLAALKVQLAAEAEAKRQAKKPPDVDDSAPTETPPAPPVESGNVKALKAQLAAQAEAKRKEKESPAQTGEPGRKKLDLAALKAELEAKKAAKQKKNDGPSDARSAGSESEDEYRASLTSQLDSKGSDSNFPQNLATLDEVPAEEAEPEGKPPPVGKSAAAKAALAAKAAAAGKGAAAKGAAGKPPLPKAAKGKEAAAAGGDDPKRYVWLRLPEDVRQAVRKIAAGGQPTPDDKLTITSALNQIMKDREFLSCKAVEKSFTNERVAEGIKTFPKGIKGIKKDWSELEVRAGSRLVMQVLYPTTRTKKRRRKVGPPRILAYLSRSEIFGEIGALLNQPRSATCVAYDHPLDDSSRKPGRVELVRIGTEVFHDLVESSPGFRSKMEYLVAERQKRNVQFVDERPWDPTSSLKSLPEFHQLGLVQGQKLMLIDLDRCTRCGDCVRACINTHDDGYSRLFLDGPRFDRFLVPSACRKCLNPSCMIGCPVGSIQRGDSDEIVIRDWCIGCGLCARQCPYDSIQMHDLGVIQEMAPGWRYQLGSAVRQDQWYAPSFRDSSWLSGIGPFPWDLNLQIPLTPHAASYLGPTLEEAVYFRLEFQIPKQQHQTATRYRLLAVSNGSAAEVWMNGVAVDLPQDAKQKKKGEYEGNLPASLLRAGRNVVAVAVRPPVEYGQMVLSLRLDAPPELEGEAGIISELKLVTEKAVVCDLCSNRPGGLPACVEECPHDAAMRVDAQRDFPRS